MDDFQRGLADNTANPDECFCMNLGVLGKEWLYKRTPVCDCPAGTSSDDEMVLHDVQCDTVPCPFCVLTGKIVLHP